MGSPGPRAVQAMYPGEAWDLGLGVLGALLTNVDQGLGGRDTYTSDLPLGVGEGFHPSPMLSFSAHSPASLLGSLSSWPGRSSALLFWVWEGERSKQAGLQVSAHWSQAERKEPGSWRAPDLPSQRTAGEVLVPPSRVTWAVPRPAQLGDHWALRGDRSS
jgi:hypothetical protein